MVIILTILIIILLLIRILINKNESFMIYDDINLFQVLHDKTKTPMYTERY